MFQIPRCRELIALAAVMVALIVVDPAGAFTPGRVLEHRCAKAVAVRNAHHGNHAQLLKELHETRALLETADHDYQGHRAKAVAQVTAAIHTLGGKRHHTHASTPPAAGAGVKGKNRKREDQATSDSQLRQALQQLQIVGKQLRSIAADKHAAKAEASVGKAIGELTIALTIK